MYVVATHGTREEEFARRQMQHLAKKGVRVREHTVADDELARGTDDDNAGDEESDGDAAGE
jgi:DNA excision repair protein ERCC-3